jgi:hypothetical protein
LATVKCPQARPFPCHRPNICAVPIKIYENVPALAAPIIPFPPHIHPRPDPHIPSRQCRRMEEEAAGQEDINIIWSGFGIFCIKVDWRIRVRQFIMIKKVENILWPIYNHKEFDGLMHFFYFFPN